jgi:hypothetical protein
MTELKPYEKSQFFKDVRNAIFDDGYIFGCIHGPPRSSKSTIALHASYSVYEDWDLVLQSLTFNLSQVIQKMEDGKPVKWPTVNGYHSRVPILIWDDFGVHGNKADTQHSTAWDIFKGGFDCLGTSIGVLLCTMVDAGEATAQLQGKYTHELTVNKKGHYKYDRVNWQQDFRGFRTMMKKEWIENGTFTAIPKEVYLQYDELRKDLTKQVFVRLKDALSMDTVPQLLKILTPDDIKLLRLIQKEGPVYTKKIQDNIGITKYKDVTTRSKARCLVLPVRVGQDWKLDLSSIGWDILKELDKPKQ